MGKILNFLKKFKSVIGKFELKLEQSNRRNYLLNEALTSNKSITSVGNDYKRELIVSLTTYSKRIHEVHLVVESMAQQTLKPNRLILWLDETEFTLDTIPLILKKQMERGLEIYFCPNYRSYKKLIPTLQNYPKANIITIDDDILYPYDMVELLYKEHIQFPDCVIGHRVHQIKSNSDGSPLPYKRWNLEISCNVAGDDIIAIGVGGIFYPYGSLNEECLKINSFNDLAPNADDIWFKAMSLLNGKTHKKVSDNRKFWNRFLLLEESQDIALYYDNKENDGNDNQVKAVFEKYKLKI